MSAQPRYCAHCGAANAAENTICVACHLALTEEASQDTLLHERYRLLTQVGAGGFGGVYRALDMAEGSQIVAIKQITLRGLSTQEMIEATDGFYREVRLLSNLKHPNLPTIRDTFTDAESQAMPMDWSISGQSAGIPINSFILHSVIYTMCWLDQANLMTNYIAQVVNDLLQLQSSLCRGSRTTG